ncbi:aldo/keto reductase, partial [Flavobacteriaceae bacterium]|nr:aldo/keto reductase [Flavobacteriaceae bacterium]
MAKSKLMLGTVQFGIDYGINNKDGVPSIKEVFEILDFAYNNGVRFLDTAEAYGDSQSVIGKFHLQNNNKFKIVTKFSPLRKDLPNNI